MAQRSMRLDDRDWDALQALAEQWELPDRTAVVRAMIAAAILAEEDPWDPARRAANAPVGAPLVAEVIPPLTPPKSVPRRTVVVPTTDCRHIWMQQRDQEVCKRCGLVRKL